MIWVWLVEAAEVVVGWVTSWFPDITVPYPAQIVILVPIPGGLSLLGINAWLIVSAAVGAALLIGRALTWLYRLIPTNG